MPLSPEAKRWLDAPWPCGRMGDTPEEAAKRMGWRVVGYLSGQAVEAVAPSQTLYTVTDTHTGPRAQRTP